MYIGFYFESFTGQSLTEYLTFVSAAHSSNRVSSSRFGFHRIWPWSIQVGRFRWIRFFGRFRINPQYDDWRIFVSKQEFYLTNQSDAFAKNESMSWFRWWPWLMIPPSSVTKMIKMSKNYFPTFFKNFAQ